MSILNCWRQFGRRYFWPHILFGMVAACLGIPALSAFSEHAPLADASSCHNRQSLVTRNFSQLIRWQENIRRPALNIDFWHQHALRQAIRQISFVLSPPIMSNSVLSVSSTEWKTEQTFFFEPLVLLKTLTALLMHEAKPSVSTRDVIAYMPQLLTPYQSGIWLAQVQGIRAGPDPVI